MVTTTTQNTTAPKNQSALEPISPRPTKMNQPMATLPARPVANNPIPRQPSIAANQRGPWRTGTVTAISSEGARTSTRSESLAALVDSASPVISTSHSPKPGALRVQTREP